MIESILIEFNLIDGQDILLKIKPEHKNRMDKKKGKKSTSIIKDFALFKRLIWNGNRMR